ncbi:Dak1 domain-containing protein, partial [Dimargaris cristalligena]
LVVESLQGLAAVYPSLAIDAHQKAIYLSIYRIALVYIQFYCPKIVGGSGHEPAHAGFVGDGMLSAAVAGQVFASPSSSQILKALRRCASRDHGSLVIVKNYTGDVINFGRAIERARWEGVAKDIRMVVVGDDVGVTSSSPDAEGDEDASDVGRRGLAGTVLVHKVAGAAAALGASLDDVYQVAQLVAQNIATIGVSLSTCTVPGATSDGRYMKNNEVEFGLGIHGEPGFETKTLDSSKNTVSQMLAKILQSPTIRSKLNGDQSHSVVLMVNNLGGTTSLELYTAAREALLYLRSQPIRVTKAYVGPFVTALDMHGISLTLLAVPDNQEAELMRYLAHAVGAPGWNNVAGGSPIDLSQLVAPTEQEGSANMLSNTSPAPAASRSSPAEAGSTNSFLSTVWKPAVIGGCRAVAAVEPLITRYDTVWGDGDCGLTLKSGATAILKGFDRTDPAAYHIPLDPRVPDHTIAAISELVEDSMGGTSGGLYCIMLDALAAQIQALARKVQDLTLDQWAHCLSNALQTLERYTTARKGHRTLMDVLIPFIESIRSRCMKALEDAVEAAQRGMEATKVMVPRRGRATYIGDQDAADSEKYQIPDPGAYGLYIIFDGILKAMQS